VYFVNKSSHLFADAKRVSGNARSPPAAARAADLNSCSSLLRKRSLWLRRGEPSAVIHQAGSVVTAWMKFIHAMNGQALGGVEGFF
jgi:hypothetical protein